MNTSPTRSTGQLARVNWHLWAPLGAMILGALLLVALIVATLARLHTVNTGVRALAAVEAQVAAEQRRQEEALSNERAELSHLQEEQTARLANLLNPAEATAVVDALYAAAAASAVEIVELQHTPQGTEGGTFTRYLVQMQVVGRLPDLLMLLARAREAAPAAGFVISHIEAEAQADRYVLRAEMLLYVSRATSATQPSGAAVPIPTLRSAAPAATVAPMLSTATAAPSATAALAPGQLRTHIVQPGDTLYSISQRYEVPIEALINFNALNSLQIRPGDRLLIP